ncbi:ADP-ribosylglycohydrolase family protein [Nocardioides sp. Root140]|uniref:ADP-ribosylglycohydrolase family protein n=1 Tax=Nocardioides sp. Root140 TaxID=1736460 RepID=UPI0006FEB93A|nr:ADP-ribosylglycohydrolase family protein [Nocardioides sp. Root140]KQY51703.1 hypothetical protein ASD30_19550 [Nocardioides sp. Root140]
MKLTSVQLDRACGVLLGSAVGDALGAGYEFGSAAYGGWPAMIGGGLGNFAPGEWTDDTAQAMAIAQAAATGVDLASTDGLDLVAAGFARWFAEGPPDVGIQTSAVLRRAGREATAEQMSAAARAVHEQTGKSAGNGSLMRTAPVALAYLGKPEAELVAAAMAVSALTHHDPLAGEGAALWCLMIRHAVLTGEFPIADDVLPHLPNASYWADVLGEAETSEPGTFVTNGWVVGGLQAAWSAITHTAVADDLACRHLQDALATAIGIGNDTDTVAAIAGGLLGARWGASAIPQEWSGLLHGWGVDGAGAPELMRLAMRIVQGGRARGWPNLDRMDYSSYADRSTCVAHPLVDGIWIGNALALDELPDEIDAVVSLCRIGATQLPEGLVSHAVRLLDTTSEENPNVDFVIDDSARTVLMLRDEGKRVLLHCVAGQSRTPTVAAWVAVLDGYDLDNALAAVTAVLPGARPKRFLVDSLRRLSLYDDAGANSRRTR